MSIVLGVFNRMFTKGQVTCTTCILNTLNVELLLNCHERKSFFPDGSTSIRCHIFQEALKLTLSCLEG